LHHIGRHARSGQAGTDGIHPNALLAQVQRQRPRQVYDAALGGIIGAVAQSPPVPDTEAVLTIEPFVFWRWGRAARQPKKTPSRSVAITFRPLLVGDVGRVATLIDAGIIDQDIQSPKALHHGRHHGVDGFAIRDVGEMGEGEFRRQIFRDTGQRQFVAVHQRD
jgi:hypothetical protein